MAKKFLSFLGTGPYKECTYNFNNLEYGQYKTNFIQEALIKTACKDWDKSDKAIIFLTDKARKINWYNEEDKTKRLKTNLENIHIEVDDVLIPDGKTEEEIWEIFDIVSNQIDEGDEIIFDITHSFRSIPMLALVVLNYVKVVKNAKILGIYYGAWEVKDENNIAPIFNLTPLDEILEWSQAVNTFLRYGNSGHLRDLSIDTLKPSFSSEEWAKDTGKFINSVNDLTMCLYTCRGMTVEGKNKTQKSISSAAKSAKENLEVVKNIKKTNQIKPLIPLIEQIENKTNMFNEKDDLQVGIASVRWCIDNDLIQQAYTALDETIKTYICLKFNLDVKDYNHREDIVKEALYIKGRKVCEDEWRVKEEYIDKVKELVDELDIQLAKLADKIGKKRNDINHFGFKEDVVSYKSLTDNISQYYEEFIKYLKEKEDI